MGYLINPISLRLGWTNSWQFSFFTRNQYYPQLLYILYKIRLYVIYLLRTRSWSEKLWLYNKLVIVNNYSGLDLHIYYYDGILQDEWYNFLNYCSRSSSVYKKGQPNRMKNWRKNSLYLDDFFLIMVLLQLYLPSKYNNLPDYQNRKQMLYYKIRGKGVRKINNEKKEWQEGEYSGEWEKGEWEDKEEKDIREEKTGLSKEKFRKLRGALYYNLLLTIIKTQLRDNNHSVYNIIRKRGSNFLNIAQWYYTIYDVLIGAQPMLYPIGLWISYMCDYIAKGIIKSKVHFYLVDSEYITAEFLSIYIAERLKQKYSLNFLINPLVKELNRLYKISISRRKIKKKTTVLAKIQYEIYKKNLYILFNNYHKINYNIYKEKNTWFNLDTLFYHFVVIKEEIGDNISSFFNNIEKRAHYFGICRTIMSKKAHTLFFFRSTFNRLYYYYLFWGIKNKNQLLKHPNYYIFIREMCNDLKTNYNNYEILNNNEGYLSKYTSTLPIWGSIKTTLWGLVGYYDYKEFYTKPSRYYHLYKVSKGKEVRKVGRNHRPDKGLIGYKIQFRGRFSRKQIAAKHIFKKGEMPLNTINANIDYAFRTVPIKNSAVGIKIWLYRGQGGSTNSYVIKTN